MSDCNALETLKVSLSSFIVSSILGVLRKYLILTAISSMPSQFTYNVNIEETLTLTMTAFGVLGFASLVVCIINCVRCVISFFKEDFY